MSKRKRRLNIQRKSGRKQQSESSVEAQNAVSGVSAQQASGGWKWMLQDGLNGVRSVVDNDINVMMSQGYTPYGDPIDVVGTQQTSYGYTGEMTDQNELVYLRNRYYNPNIGVFVSQDPVEGSMSNPMSLNRYAYAQGNPVNMTDPSGMLPVGVMNYLLQSNPLMFAQMMNTGLCVLQQLGCPNPPFCTNTPYPSQTPSSTPSPTQSPIQLSSVFGGTSAAPLQGATTALFGPGHYAVDIVPSGTANAAGEAVYAVCDGYALHQGNQASNPNYDTVIEQTCQDDPDRNLLIYSHVCPANNLRNYIPAGTQLGTIADLGGSAGQCDGVFSRSHYEYFGAAHLHLEVERNRFLPTPTPAPGGYIDPAQQYVSPARYLVECQGTNPPAWCADASDPNPNPTSTPTSTPTSNR